MNNNTNSFRGLIYQSFQSGHWLQCLEYCIQELSKEPNDADTLLVAATASINSSKNPEALAFTDRLVRLQPHVRDHRLLRDQIVTKINPEHIANAKEVDLVVETGANPLVSVILPTRDRLSFLKRSLESLAVQTFQDFEVIVVNDGGVPIHDVIAYGRSKGLDIIELNIAHKKGASAARNMALLHSRGTWIAYLDDDDIYLPKHLEIVISALLESDFFIAYSDSIRSIERLIENEWRPIRSEIAMSIDFDRNLFLSTNITPIINVIHHRECWIECGPFDESLEVLEDWEFWIRLSRRWDFMHLPIPTAEIRWRENKTNATFDKQSLFPLARAIISERVKSRFSDPLLELNGISIVIVGSNQLANTIAALKSVQGSTQAVCEIIIVSNATSSNDRSVLQNLTGEYPNVTMVFNNVRYRSAERINQGLALGRGKYLFVMDPDTLCLPNCLNMLADSLSQEPTCGIASPALYDDTNAFSMVAYSDIPKSIDATLGYLKRFGSFFLDSQIPKEGLGCFLVRRNVIDQIGGLDERFDSSVAYLLDFFVRAHHVNCRHTFVLESFVSRLQKAGADLETHDSARVSENDLIKFSKKWNFPFDPNSDSDVCVESHFIPLSCAFQRIPIKHPSHDHFVNACRTIWMQES